MRLEHSWPEYYMAPKARMFCGLPSQTLQVFEAVKSARTYQKGALLFAEGQVPPGIFIIRAGRVKLFASARSGKSLIARTAGPGDILGLSATVCEERQQVTAETLEVCEVDFVGREEFLRVMRDHVDICFKVAQQLGVQYRAVWAELSLRAQSVHTRLAKLLLEWKPRRSTSFEREPRIELVLTHAEIAERLGVARETVSRAFRYLEEQGILKGKGSSWMICNEPALKVMSGIEDAESFTGLKS